MYRYVSGNPLRYWDPFGLCPLEAIRYNGSAEQAYFEGMRGIRQDLVDPLVDNSIEYVKPRLDNIVAGAGAGGVAGAGVGTTIGAMFAGVGAGPGALIGGLSGIVGGAIEGLLSEPGTTVEESIRDGAIAGAIDGAIGAFGSAYRSVGKAADTVADLSRPVRSNAELVQEVANRAGTRAERFGNNLSPAALGTKQHRYASNLLERYQTRYGDRGLMSEVSFLNGDKVVYGTPGSIRIDVLDITSDTAFDFKFGASGLSPTRVANIRQHSPVESVWEIRPE